MTYTLTNEHRKEYLNGAGGGPEPPKLREDRDCVICRESYVIFKNEP